MPRLDHLSKSLPIACIHDIIAAYLPGITDLTADPTELTLPPRLQMDLVYRAMYHGHPCLIHIEMQTRGDPTMPRRVYHYAAALNASQPVDLPIFSFVIWFAPSHVTEPVYRVIHDGVEVNQWHYRDIAVYTLTKEQIVAQGIGLLPFAAFAKDMTKDDVIPFAQQVQASTPPELGSLLVHIYVAMMQQRFREIDPVIVLQKAGLAMNAIEEILYNSSLLDAVKTQYADAGKAAGLAEGKAEGKAAGLAEGKTAGLAEGEAIGLVTAIISLWPTKFTEPLSAELQTQLLTLPVNQLRFIVQHWVSDEPTVILARLDRW